LQRLAVTSLTHDRTKLASALAGVAFATTLVITQAGIYSGFVANSSAIIRHAGGDVWIMARGTRVVDFGETLSPGARSAVMAHPCVERVRPLTFTFVPLRKKTGGFDSMQILGFELDEKGPVLPWSLSQGLSHDLEEPMSIAVDEGDVGKLELPANPLGATMEIRGRLVRVAAVTRGIRAFTLQPYGFSSIRTARRLSGIADGRATFLVADLREPSCAPSVIQAAERWPELQAMTTEKFATTTERYWVNGSGAGAVLGFSTLLGLVVGVVIVGQTLYSMTKDYEPELATLKAMGASRGELASFVGWQAAFLGCLGAALGTVLALGLRRLVEGAGLVVVLSSTVLLGSYLAIVFMCSTASIGSMRRVLSLEAGQVFK